MLESYAGEIASVASAVIWALALTLFARAGRTVSPRALNVFKNTVAAPLILVTMLALGIDIVPPFDGWTWMVLALSAVLGISISDTLLFASLNRIGAGWTAVVTCTYAPLMIALTALAFGVPLTAAVAAGTLLVAAAILLAAGRLRFDPDRGRELMFGLALGVASQLVMAIGVSLLKYPVMGHPAVFDAGGVVAVTFWRLLVGTGTLALWMLSRGESLTSVFRPAQVWRWMLPGAFLASYVSMILWVYGMKAITGSLARAAILNQTTAILLPLFGALILHERLSARKLLAVLLAFAGASVVVAGR